MQIKAMDNNVEDALTVFCNSEPSARPKLALQRPLKFFFNPNLKRVVLNIRKTHPLNVLWKIDGAGEVITTGRGHKSKKQKAKGKNAAKENIRKKLTLPCALNVEC